MNGIQLMIEEHKTIKRMLEVIRSYCLRILNGKEVAYQDIFKMIDFVRSYADQHHHGKEEDLLFKFMTEELGSTAEKLVRNGMLVEHDLGRLYMRELEEATEKMIQGDEEAKVDVIGHAMSYYHLLQRHIDKEDGMVYKYGEDNLSKETIERVNRETRILEEEATKKGIQEKYENLVKELEEKYVTR
jgi:hemerythrin-like domain-containing protein